MTEQTGATDLRQGAPVVESKQSVGELVRDVTEDVLKLMKQELQLAKIELRDEATQAAKAGGLLGGAGVAAHLFLVFISLTAAFALDAVMPLGWAAAIVSAVWGIAAFVLYSIGRKRMASVNLAPEQTMKTLKEDVRWAQNRSN